MLPLFVKSFIFVLLLSSVNVKAESMIRWALLDKVSKFHKCVSPDLKNSRHGRKRRVCRKTAVRRILIWPKTSQHRFLTFRPFRPEDENETQKELIGLNLCNVYDVVNKVRCCFQFRSDIASSDRSSLHYGALHRVTIQMQPRESYKQQNPLDTFHIQGILSPRRVIYKVFWWGDERTNNHPTNSASLLL